MCGKIRGSTGFPDLHGYYDTDEECAEHNTNDDLIDTIIEPVIKCLSLLRSKNNSLVEIVQWGIFTFHVGSAETCDFESARKFFYQSCNFYGKGQRHNYGTACNCPMENN